MAKLRHIAATRDQMILAEKADRGEASEPALLPQAGMAAGG
jgi:hypothetical protein